MEKRKYIGRKALALFLALVMVVSSLGGLTGCDLFGGVSASDAPAVDDEAALDADSVIEAWETAKTEAKNELREWYETNITNAEKLSILFWDRNKEYQGANDSVSSVAGEIIYYTEADYFGDIIYYTYYDNFYDYDMLPEIDSIYAELDYFAFYVLEDYENMDYTPKYTTHRALIEIPEKITEFFEVLDNYELDSNEITNVDDILIIINRLREECGIFVGENDITFEGIPTYEEDQENHFEEFYIITNGDMYWYETSYDWSNAGYEYMISYYDDNYENIMYADEITHNRWTKHFGIGDYSHFWYYDERFYDIMRAYDKDFYCKAYTTIGWDVGGVYTFDSNWNVSYCEINNITVKKRIADTEEYEEMTSVIITYEDIFDACLSIFADDVDFMELYEKAQTYYDAEYFENIVKFSH